MPNFIFAYHGGKAPDNDEEAAKEMARWKSWFESLGDAVVDAGNPVGMSSTVGADGVREDGGSNPLAGYSIVRAASKQEAVEMAKGCPMDDAGTIEVAEILEMMS